MIEKVLLIFNFFVIRVTYSKYLNDNIIEINTFHNLECQFTPFRVPILAISHFALLILTKKREKQSNVFMISVAEFIFFMKKVESSVYLVYRKIWLNIFRSSICFNQSKIYF